MDPKADNIYTIGAGPLHLGFEISDYMKNKLIS